MAEKIGGRGKKIPSGTLVNKEYLKRSSSHVHRRNATIYGKHRMMTAVMKKTMMVLSANFKRSPGQN